MRQTSESNPRPTLNRNVDLPEGARPLRINLPYLIVIGAVHLLSLLVLDPWYFSWAGVLSLVFGYFLFGILGITVGFHRLLSHRSFECPKWFEYCLALLGTCCLQESAVWWVSVHRRHHLHTDYQPDPHTPKAGMLWSHIGWLLLINRESSRKETYHRFTRDLTRQVFIPGPIISW